MIKILNYSLVYNLLLHIILIVPVQLKSKGMTNLKLKKLAISGVAALALSPIATTLGNGVLLLKK